MDNRTIDVVSEGSRGLALAMELIWPNAPGGKATNYKIVPLVKKTTYVDRDGKTVSHYVEQLEQSDGIPTLILLWSKERDSKPLPYPHDLKKATLFVEGWLESVDYGRGPDHDGDNEKGWRIFTEAWGNVAGHQYAIVAIQPAWAMYGK